MKKTFQQHRIDCIVDHIHEYGMIQSYRNDLYHTKDKVVVEIHIHVDEATEETLRAKLTFKVSPIGQVTASTYFPPNILPYLERRVTQLKDKVLKEF